MFALSIMVIGFFISSIIVYRIEDSRLGIHLILDKNFDLERIAIGMVVGFVISSLALAFLVMFN